MCVSVFTDVSPHLWDEQVLIMNKAWDKWTWDKVT